MIRVLAIGCERAALRSGRGLLEAGGIQVVCAKNEADAGMLLRTQRFDVVTIGARVGLEQRNKVAAVAKSRYNAGVIFLYRGSVFHAELADALLSADVSTEDLISTIERLASRQNRNDRLSRSAG